MSMILSAQSDFLEVLTRPKKIYKVRSTATLSRASLRDKVYLTEDETKRIYKNILVLSFAMMLQYVAYEGTLNLQSTLHTESNLGKIGLCMVYFSVSFSGIFLPTLIIRTLTVKTTLAVTMSCYTPYIAAQLYPSFCTMLPASALLGIAGAPMWAAQSTYLTQLAQVYAKITKQNVDAVIVRFFGIFYFTWQNGDTFGNLISSWVTMYMWRRHPYENTYYY